LSQDEFCHAQSATPSVCQLKQHWERDIRAGLGMLFANEPVVTAKYVRIMAPELAYIAWSVVGIPINYSDGDLYLHAPIPFGTL
jgi:hypothetical protein